MSTEDSFVLKLNGVNEILTRKRQTHVCLPLILCRMLEEIVLEKIAARTMIVANLNIHNVMWVFVWHQGNTLHPGYTLKRNIGKLICRGLIWFRTMLYSAFRRGRNMVTLFWPKGSGDNLRDFIFSCCLLEDNFLSVLCYIVIITKPSPLAKINFVVAFSDRPIYGPNPVKSNGDISSHNLKHSEYLLKTLLINQSKRNHELSSLTHTITSQVN